VRSTKARSPARATDAQKSAGSRVKTGRMNNFMTAEVGKCGARAGKAHSAPNRGKTTAKGLRRSETKTYVILPVESPRISVDLVRDSNLCQPRQCPASRWAASARPATPSQHQLERRRPRCRVFPPCTIFPRGRGRPRSRDEIVAGCRLDFRGLRARRATNRVGPMSNCETASTSFCPSSDATRPALTSNGDAWCAGASGSM
jgi:hypothetical protein